ncbi:hypothetical protein BIWAKO_05482 [Bosea sp. BIWAKO-01]|nr:hypothetical protein BIWAKO_05482 [Bosea sp. BIWAKO-01]
MSIDTLRRGITLGAISSIGLLMAGTVSAQTLAAPTDKVILTISGKISVTNSGDTAQFDRAALEAMGLMTIETNTPWYSGPQKFEGISLDKLMKSVGAKGDTVQAIALNDYTTEIPLEDFAKYNVILALKRNAEYMPIRDKGPLFIVYPYDSNPELRSQKFYSRSAWQVSKLIVR